MKSTLAKKIHPGNRARRAEQGSVRPVVLSLVSFLLGVGVAALWLHRPASENEASAPQTAAQPPAAQPAPPAATPPGAPSPIPSPAPAPAVATPPSMDPAVIEEVKKLVPNYASISLADGESILRAAAIKDFQAATTETDAQIKAARQQLLDAENGQSAADQQTAMKSVQDAQVAAAQKLKDIAIHLQAQIAALKSLKNQP